MVNILLVFEAPPPSFLTVEVWRRGGGYTILPNIIKLLSTCGWKSVNGMGEKAIRPKKVSYVKSISILSSKPPRPRQLAQSIWSESNGNIFAPSECRVFFRSTLVGPTLIVCIVIVCVQSCFVIPINLGFLLRSSFQVYMVTASRKYWDKYFLSQNLTIFKKQITL